jgi:hypothetical protein
MNVETSLSKITNSFTLILNRVLCGLMFGFAGGILAGAIGSIIYWVSTKYFYDSLYANITISEVIWADILLIGIPISLILGLSTGMYAGVFRNHVPKQLLWISLTTLSVVLAVWLSGFRVNNPIGFLLEITFIGCATSLLLHRVTMKEHQNEPSIELTTLICVIGSSLLTFLMVYGYFRFWIYLQNIPS